MDPQDISLVRGGSFELLLQCLQSQQANQYSKKLEGCYTDNKNYGRNNNNSIRNKSSVGQWEEEYCQWSRGI